MDINAFKWCSGLRVLGYFMILLVAAIVAVSYYAVVVLTWGPQLLRGGLHTLLASAILFLFHLLVISSLSLSLFFRKTPKTIKAIIYQTLCSLHCYPGVTSRQCLRTPVLSLKIGDLLWRQKRRIWRLVVVVLSWHRLISSRLML